MADVWSYLQDIKQQQAEERQKQLAESQNIADQQRIGTLMGGLSESAAQVGTIGGQQAKSTLGDFNNQITKATADEYARNQAARRPDQMLDLKVIEHLAKQKPIQSKFSATSFTDASGRPLTFNPDTGAYAASEGSSAAQKIEPQKSPSQSNFTDANGAPLIFDPNTSSYKVAGGPAGMKHAPQALGTSDKQRLDNTTMGLKSAMDMNDALLKQGNNTFSLVGDNNFTLARRNWEDAIGRLQSGGAINNEEASRFRRMAPTATDTAEIQRKKLDEMQILMRNRLKTLGQDPDKTMASYIGEADKIAVPGETPPASGTAQAAPAGHPQDQAALNWAKANPQDPRAQKILQMNGGQ